MTDFGRKAILCSELRRIEPSETEWLEQLELLEQLERFFLKLSEEA
jgi:hypothetical protein